MNRIARCLLGVALLGAMTTHQTLADGKGEWSFQRVGTFANYHNATLIEPTVAEIIAATADGRTLVYTDAVRGAIGIIDITDPARPLPGGSILLDPDPTDGVSFSPTSVEVLRNRYALVTVDTSASKANPSGRLMVIDLASREVVSEIDLGGQPDSAKISPDHRFLAIAIENERNEDIEVGGVEGGLPQAPAGYLAVVRLHGPPSNWFRQDVSLTGIADLYPDDPEPEFVDVNDANQAVVTLQENNHIAIVDLERLRVVRHFPAGAVTLNGVDLTDNLVIAPVETASDVLREPDSAAWVGRRIATANEGDLDGGSRGFTIFDADGSVFYDSGTLLDRLAVRFGHYPERRSDAKGTEPESIVFAKYGPNDVLFVGAERGSFVAVFQLDRRGRPEFSQLLPAPLGPEGLLAIPHRNLLVASGENDTPPFGVRSTVMIYQLKPGTPTYPQIYSANDASGAAIPWSALSGLTEIPGQDDKVQAVWDGFYAQSTVFTIAVDAEPARIERALTLTRANGTATNYDPEGLAYAPDGSLWIASEGNLADSRSNRLIKVDPVTGVVAQEIELPQAVRNCRTAERAKAAPNGTGTLGSGFEGLDIQRKPGGGYLVFVAQQRGWNFTSSPACDALDDDPSDTDTLEPTWTRIWVYDAQAGTWGHIPYQLEPKPANAAWIGLSEITLVDDGWVLIERDNLTGDFGVFKKLSKLPLTPGADGAFTRGEKAFYDLRPRLTATRGWITDKPEGVAVLPNGRLFVVTDNDGVDGWSGETWFFGLGRYWNLFR
jgi:DNA-binding beta-propeller fold protein YncE